MVCLAGSYSNVALLCYPNHCRQYPVGVLYDMMVVSGETPWKIWVRYQVRSCQQQQ